MIIKDILDVLDSLDGEQRQMVIVGLMEEFTDASQYAVLECQFKWDNNKGIYDRFIEYQDQIIRECIEIELTQFGEVLRRIEGKAPLTLRTEIRLKAPDVNMTN